MLGFPDLEGLPRSGRRFTRNVRVYGPAFVALSKSEDLAKRLESGDKIILYASLLRELSSVLDGEPLVFEAEAKSRRSHVGVLEFSGEEPGVAFFPSWLMASLRIKDADLVKLSLRSLPTVSYVRLIPRDASFAARLGRRRVGDSLGSLRLFKASLKADMFFCDSLCDSSELCSRLLSTSALVMRRTSTTIHPLNGGAGKGMSDCTD